MATKKKTATVTKKKVGRKKTGGKKVVTTVTTTTTTETVTQVPTKVAFVVDSSGSMGHLKGDVIRMFNSLLADLKTNDPTAEISLVYFGGGGGGDVKVQFENVGISQVHEINERTYNPQGMTPLYDGVAEALKVLGDDPNYAYLVYTLTDGYENASRQYNSRTFAELVAKKQATDLFTLAFLVPPGSRQEFANTSGVHIGNIREWEASTQGLKSVAASNSVSVSNYYATRASGQKATRSLFEVDLLGVTKKDFGNLPEVQDSYKIWTVDKETDIKSFVESHNLPFRIGAGFYSLSKKETVAGHKDILVAQKGEKTLRSNGRQLLGMPSGDVRVDPKNLSAYELFVQSTSTNRKLVRGTRFVYFV